MLEKCHSWVIPVSRVKPVDEEANALRQPVDSHEEKELKDDLEVPPVDWVGIILDARRPDPTRELEDKENIEDEVEEQEEEEGEVEEEEEGQEHVEAAGFLQVWVEHQGWVCKLLQQQSDEKKQEGEAERDAASPLAFSQLASLPVRRVLALRVLQRSERPPDAPAHGGQGEEHGEGPVLDHQPKKDAKSFNALCCFELADEDEEEGDEGADEEWHFELCEVVQPQLLNKHVEYYEGK